MTGFKAIYKATSLGAIAVELRRRADALVAKAETIRSAGTKRETLERAVGLREAAALLDDTVLIPETEAEKEASKAASDDGSTAAALLSRAQVAGDGSIATTAME